MAVRVDDLDGVDPYGLLGVDPSADREAIESAHRRLMRQAHPDLARGDGSWATLLNVARDVLLDEQARLAYDQSTRGVSPAPAEPHQPWATAPVWQAPVWQPPAPRPAPETQHPATATDDALPDGLDVLMAGMASASAPPARWGTGPALGVLALLLTVACFPLGVALATIALVRNRHPMRADRVCAWSAMALGMFVLWVSAYVLSQTVANG